MSRFVHAGIVAVLILAPLAGCGKGPAEQLGPPETFHWVSQPITFSPPSGKWERQGDNGGGMLGVRFILTGGGGQCISVLAQRQLADSGLRHIHMCIWPAPSGQRSRSARIPLLGSDSRLCDPAPGNTELSKSHPQQ